MRRFRILIATLAAVGLATTGCSPLRSEDDVVVFAASSLTDVMGELTAAYSAQRPGTRFTLNSGSSAQLVQQINSGEPADILITADEQAVGSLADRELFEPETRILATNALVLALAPGNPAGIAALQDLEAGTAVALCAAGVPCGRSARAVLASAGIELAAVTEEDNVRAVLTKVSAGQVDAGFVYRTDALAAAGQGVTALELPGTAPNRYPLLTARDAGAPARGFAAWLEGAEAAEILRGAGFGGAGGDGTGTP